MATRDSGYAPVTVRTLQDCPEYSETKPNSGCKPCKQGDSRNCRHPYRPGKTRRENLRFRVKV